MYGVSAFNVHFLPAAAFYLLGEEHQVDPYSSGLGVCRHGTVGVSRPVLSLFWESKQPPAEEDIPAGRVSKATTHISSQPLLLKANRTIALLLSVKKSASLCSIQLGPSTTFRARWRAETLASG